ncbi:MAG: hypothetical protein BMS9Abin15_0550 [Gammaproteobacteria bacterium]|nr:MAG: hypothetical protein BMS9Abin15_0550 [Gammaproteobacteria bacterium]
MTMDPVKLKNIIEAALLAADGPVSVDRLLALFPAKEQPPTRDDVNAALETLGGDLEGRSIELKKVASGYRIQVRSDFAPWISRLWSERPPRYTRAQMETLALIAYRQPITRGEIEDIRGVSLSSNITRSLLERDWVRVVGQRDVPGKPSLYGTTKAFLDYFNLKTLKELPTLAEIRDIDQINPELPFDLMPPAADTGGSGGTPAKGEEAEDAPETA